MIKVLAGASKGHRTQEQKDEQQDAEQKAKMDAEAERAGVVVGETEQNAEGAEEELKQGVEKQGGAETKEDGVEGEEKNKGEAEEKIKEDAGEGGEEKTERGGAGDQEETKKDDGKEKQRGSAGGEKIEGGGAEEKEGKKKDDGKEDGGEGGDEEETKGGEGKVNEDRGEENTEEDPKPSKSTRPPLVMSPAAYKAQIVKNTPGKESTQSKNTTIKDKEESPEILEPEVPLPDDSVQVPSSSPTVTEETAETKEDPLIIPKRINYASVDKGAVILATNKEGKNAENILNENADKYFQSPCSDRRWIVLQLSEDITVHSVVLANLEQFSSHTKEFQVLGSVKHPTKEWMLLGEFKTTNDKKEQEFKLLHPVCVRYIKLRLRSHWGTEPVCTLSLLRVHGETILAVLEEAFDDSKRELEELAETIKAMSENVDSTPEATDGDQEEAEATDEDEKEAEATDEDQEEAKTDPADNNASVVIEEQDTKAGNANATEGTEAAADNALDIEAQGSSQPEKVGGQVSNTSTAEATIEAGAATTDKQKTTSANVPSPESDLGTSPSDSVNRTSAETNDETKAAANVSGNPSVTKSPSTEAKVVPAATAAGTTATALHNKTTAPKETGAAVSSPSAAVANDSNKTTKQSTANNAGVIEKSSGQEGRPWRVLNQTRCNIGDGEKSRVTLKACKTACGSKCPFVLYHPNSPLEENCWIANASHSVASNCFTTDGKWTVFIRPDSSTASASTADATAPASTPDVTATSSEATTKDNGNATGTDSRTSRDETTKSNAKAADEASSGKNPGTVAHTDAKTPAAAPPEVNKVVVESTKKQPAVAKKINKTNKKAGNPAEKKKIIVTPKQEVSSSKKSVKKKVVVGDAKSKSEPPNGFGGALTSSGASSIFHKLAKKITNLEIDQLSLNEYLNQLNSNYTKVIWDMNDTATAAIGNSSLQCRKRHDKLRERLKNMTTIQATLNSTVIDISRRVEALNERVGELVTELRQKKDVPYQYNTWLASPVAPLHCNLTDQHFQMMDLAMEMESQSQIESESYQTKMNSVSNQLWDLRYKVWKEAASGKQMWNTALDRLSFERSQTRQMLRSMRSQLTFQMHTMINESLDVVTTVLNSSTSAENSSKRKQKANVQRIKALRREVSRLKQNLQSMKQKNEQAAAPPTPAQLFAGAPSVSVAINALTNVLGESRSGPILAFLGLGSFADEYQGDHPELEQLSRIVSAMFLVLVVSLVSSFLACLGMGVLCIAFCCRSGRPHDSVPSIIIPRSKSTMTPNKMPPSLGIHDEMSPLPSIHREMSPVPDAEIKNKQQFSSRSRLFQTDSAEYSDGQL